MINRRKKYSYVNTPIEKEKIKKFWKKKSLKHRLATELFMSDINIKISDIQKRYNVYISYIYQCVEMLKFRGLVYEV